LPPIPLNNILPIRRPPKTFSLDQEDTLEDTITTTYYLCEELLKAIGHHDDPQVRLSTAEVMTIALVACAFFCGKTLRPAARFWTSTATYRRRSLRVASTDGCMP
jgi:hypothetical protein